MKNIPISSVELASPEQYSALEEEARLIYKTTNLTGLLRVRSHPTRTLLVLDFDGSNSPFVPQPDDAQLYPGLRERIIGLKARGYTIAFSSGRGIFDLISAVGIPHVENYAGSHGSQVLITKKHLHSTLTRELDSALETAYRSIFSEITPRFGFSPGSEFKPGNAVLHWREYTELHGIEGAELEDLEERLYGIINPAVDAYNAANPDLPIKVANHGQNADFSYAIAPTKGDALLKFYELLRGPDGRPFRNIVTLNDSETDGDMILKADHIAQENGVFALAITVEQNTTPDWMLSRPLYDIKLPFLPVNDPHRKFGGVPLVPFVYDTLLGK